MRPATTPAMNRMAIAIACSAAFAVDEIGPRFNSRMTLTIVPMPNAMSRPGSTRVSQSNVSNGTNGKPATLHAKDKIPVSAAVSMAATNRPAKTLGRRILIRAYLFRATQVSRAT